MMFFLIGIYSKLKPCIPQSNSWYINPLNQSLPKWLRCSFWLVKDGNPNTVSDEVMIYQVSLPMVSEHLCTYQDMSGEDICQCSYSPQTSSVAGFFHDT